MSQRIAPGNTPSPAIEAEQPAHPYRTAIPRPAYPSPPLVEARSRVARCEKTCGELRKQVAQRVNFLYAANGSLSTIVSALAICCGVTMTAQQPAVGASIVGATALLLGAKQHLTYLYDKESSALRAKLDAATGALWRAREEATQLELDSLGCL